ncbi:MAG: nucleoside triphosphate pyrophosphohydrolase [Bacteroidales bacterium]|jgi:XTP/dITP diphosphohydrolase|nr:nucleoside triphosphate pyrophosphohydrolase [Bacteroidales bacterium]
MTDHTDTLKEMARLIDILDELRQKCPWDREQSLESLRKLTVEETYELSEAIIQGDMPEVRKELGDLLLHIVFYAKIAAEQQAFTLKEVITSLNDKLIYRHPHVFGTVIAEDAQKVCENWESLKLREKDRKKKTVLEGVPNSLPPLVKAFRIQEKVSAVGFDWDRREQVWDKVAEEVAELRHEVTAAHRDKAEAEFGDVLFALVNAARLYGIDPEAALERTNIKFMNRFNYLESQTMKKGMDLKKMSLPEMDRYWEEAKKFEKN